MRQKTFNAVSSTKLWRLDNRRLELCLYNHKRKGSYIPTSTDPFPRYQWIAMLRPGDVRINERGPFDWANWSGEPSKLPNIEFGPNQNSKFVYPTTSPVIRTNLYVHDGENLLPLSPKVFWREHHIAARYSVHSVHSFYKLHYESSVICFLLRTAPPEISGPLSKVIRAFNTTLSELQEQIDDLMSMRKFMTHSRLNPLYFKAGVQKLRIQNEREMLGDNNENNYPSSAWSRQSSKIYRLSTGDTPLERNDATCKLLPESWAIEPLRSGIETVSQVITENLQKVEHFLCTTELETSPLYLIAKHVRTTRKTLWELRRSCDDITALRYYHLQHFPGSITEREINLGKRFIIKMNSPPRPVLQPQKNIYRYIRSESEGTAELSLDSIRMRPLEDMTSTPAFIGMRLLEDKTTASAFRRVRQLEGRATAPTSARMQRLEDKITTRLIRVRRLEDWTTTHLPQISRELRLKTNSRGLFSWDRWLAGEAGDWRTEDLLRYREEPCVKDAATAKQKWENLKKSVVHTTPRKVDEFMLANHYANWMGNQRLTTFLDYTCNINAILFLLRTGPSRILATKASAFSLHVYELGFDIEALRSIQIMLAHLPHNPLYFKGRVKHYGEGWARWYEMNKLKAVELKSFRADRKALAGSNFGQRNFALDQARRLELQKINIDIARSLSFTWQRKEPYGMAEPLLSSLSLIHEQYRVLDSRVNILKQVFTRLIGPNETSKKLQNFTTVFEQSRHLMILCHDLAALRYYRVQRYPESIPKREWELNWALVDQLKKYRLENNPDRKKVPGKKKLYQVREEKRKARLEARSKGRLRAIIEKFDSGRLRSAEEIDLRSHVKPRSKDEGLGGGYRIASIKGGYGPVRLCYESKGSFKERSNGPLVRCVGT
ncbi:hypothetical protein GQ44DRAFT_698025 [Phaeosphaeriaceae sp. PMI808]|nr:hypothetical protein GQ44DRAFT_698025 [Phaeosphaeriaceae sp. PMI808]